MILDTFYLLFKSNSQQAQVDVTSLEKKIESLTKTGKKRTEQENKDLKDAQKQYKELQNDLKNTQDQYTKMVESATQAIVGFVSFKALAGGIFDTATTNSNLEIQSKLLGQNVSDVKAYSAAVEAAGGNTGEFSSYLQGLFERFSAVGLKLPQVDEVVNKIRQSLKQAAGDVQQQEMIFQKFNISSAGLKSFFLLPDDKFAESIAKQKQFSDNVEEGAKVARQYAEEWSNTKTAVDSVFTTIGTDLLPIFTKVNKSLQEFFGYLKDNRNDAEIVFGGAAVAITALSGVIISTLVPALASAGIAATPLLLLAGVGAGAYKGAKALYDWSSTVGYGKNLPQEAKTGKLSLTNKESFRTSSEPLGENDTPEMRQQRELRNAKSALNIATSTQIGSFGNSSSVGGDKSLNVKTGDIHVHTNATDSQGIAGSIANDLISQIRSVTANLDDGVNY